MNYQSRGTQYRLYTVGFHPTQLFSQESHLLSEVFVHAGGQGGHALIIFEGTRVG